MDACPCFRKAWCDLHKEVFWDEQPQLQITNPLRTHTRVLQDFSLTSLADLKYFIKVFWKFTALFDHQHRFFLCRENHYESSMMECINQLSTQSFGTDLIVVIVQLRSAEAILKRVKSVNHCCKERISMHCYSDPHFSTDPANEYLIRKIQSVWPCILICSHFEMEMSTNSEDWQTISSEGTTSQYVEYKVACIYWCGMQCL